MLKVGLTGAHGVGKTTLCGELVKLLRQDGINVSQTPEVPREIIAKVRDPFFFRRGNNTLPRQLHILLRQLNVERSNESSQVLICDRTLLDHWAYTIALFPDFSDPATRAVWRDFVIKYLRSYGRLFYLPIEIRAQDDGIREDNVDFQREIDTLIHDQLNAAELPYCTVRGSLAQRGSMCLAAIKNLI